MEQHPVPQNVTGFQFKLIGDITLKQFAYLAGGIIVAYITFKLSLIPVLLRYPTAIFSVLLGFGLAFVPIEERPLDRWIMSFFKSIYSPTQYVWKKNNSAPEILTQSSLALSTLPVPVVSPAAPSQLQASIINQPPPLIKPPPAVKPAAKKPSTHEWWAMGAPAVKTAPVPTPGTPYS